MVISNELFCDGFHQLTQILVTLVLSINTLQFSGIFNPLLAVDVDPQ